ncbi:MAG: branched-chain amino acid ABC transporter permease, partial [Pseudanabaena sp. SU_2_4]|nr:branched-chain amino acid ABC transporter permease [Pseudanabaena sp. SU_2_4]
IAVLICEKFLWQPLRWRRATSTTMMIVSIGLALVIRNGIILVAGTSPKTYSLPTLPGLNLIGIVITGNRLVTMGMAIAAVAGLYYLLQNTKIGRAMRAVADNPELAKITGINVDAVILWTWVIAGSLTALGGGMYGLITGLRPNMGWFLVLPMFTAVILGGIGNPYGAIAGAMIVGIAQQVSTTCPASLGELAKYCIGTEYKLGVGLLIMVLVLLVRPQGLFKGTM